WSGARFGPRLPRVIRRPGAAAAPQGRTTIRPRMTRDEQFMQRALALAEQGRYSVSPNPMVGCVIVRDDLIIAEGFHRRAGGPHAEVEAIQNCEEPRGATMYVTLEPCAHH